MRRRKRRRRGRGRVGNDLDMGQIGMGKRCYDSLDSHSYGVQAGYDTHAASKYTK